MTDAPADFQVEVLTCGDVRTLRAMLGLFGRAFDDPQSYLANPPDDAYLDTLLARDTFVAIAALQAGHVIGALAGYVLPKFEQARSEFYIYDLAVDAVHRRRGIATSMIRRLQRHLAAGDTHVIFVQADHGDEAAIALYTKLGIREDVLHFDLQPPPRRP